MCHAFRVNGIVGGYTFEAYSLQPNPSASEDQYYDAAYIILDNSIAPTLTNKIANLSSKRLLSISYDNQISSYNNAPIEAYRSTTNVFVSGIALISYYNGTYGLESTLSPFPGDSGGPIYLTGDYNNRLLGIIRTQQGGGTLWKKYSGQIFSIKGNHLDSIYLQQLKRLTLYAALIILGIFCACQKQS